MSGVPNGRRHLQKGTVVEAGLLPLNFRGSSSQAFKVPRRSTESTHSRVHEDTVSLGSMGAKLHCFTEACHQDMDHARKLVAEQQAQAAFRVKAWG